MATKDSQVLIFSARDDLVRFWSHSDAKKYRFCDKKFIQAGYTSQKYIYKKNIWENTP